MAFFSYLEGYPRGDAVKWVRGITPSSSASREKHRLSQSVQRADRPSGPYILYANVGTWVTWLVCVSQFPVWQKIFNFAMMMWAVAVFFHWQFRQKLLILLISFTQVRVGVVPSSSSSDIFPFLPVPCVVMAANMALERNDQLHLWLSTEEKVLVIFFRSQKIKYKTVDENHESDSTFRFSHPRYSPEMNHRSRSLCHCRCPLYTNLLNNQISYLISTAILPLDFAL